MTLIINLIDSIQSVRGRHKMTKCYARSCGVSRREAKIAIDEYPN